MAIAAAAAAAAAAVVVVVVVVVAAAASTAGAAAVSCVAEHMDSHSTEAQALDGQRPNDLLKA